jgi:hypothetical protein
VKYVNQSYPAELSLLALGAFHVKNMFLNPANVRKNMHVSKQRTFAGTGNMVDTKDVRILQPIMNVFVGYELCIQNKYFFRLIWSL